MNESGYWAALEFRVCREFAGMADEALCRLWCDGFAPERYSLDESPPRITGRAWICAGQRQEEWTFTLFPGHAARSRDTIAWENLLPAEDVTHWLAVDRGRREIQIEPLAAIPDRPQVSEADAPN